MAFGFPAYHTERYVFPETRLDPYELVVEAIQNLQWKLRSESDTEIRASVGFNFWSFGERITIRFDTPDEVTVTSKCVLPTQCNDWGKNRSNVFAFLSRVERLIEEADGNTW